MRKVAKVLRHYQFTAFAVIIVALLSVWMFGCESTVTSPFNPDHKVTRAELKIELDTYLAKVDLAVMDLNRQDEVRAKITEIGTILAQGGTVNPVGAGLGLLSILGIGAVADNRKKDSLIKILKNAA